MTSLFGLRRRNWRDFVSAYVDGELHGADLAWFETQLSSVPDAAVTVELERATSRLVTATLPEVEVPRSFAITPELAARSRPEPVRPPVDSARLFGRLTAGASIAAAVALAFVTVVDLQQSGTQSAGDDSFATMAAPEAMGATAEDDPERTAGGEATDDADGGANDGALLGTPAPEATAFYDAGDATAPPGADGRDASALAQGAEDTQLKSTEEGDGDGADRWRTLQVVFGLVLVASVGGYIFNRRTREQ